MKNINKTGDEYNNACLKSIKTVDDIRRIVKRGIE